MAKKTKRKANSAPLIVKEPTIAAGIRIRLAALVYDSLLLMALWMVVSAPLVIMATDTSAAAQHELKPLSAEFRYFVLFPSLTFVTWLFYAYFWRRNGQTLGMQTWNLRLINHSGNPISFKQSLIRFLAASLFPTLCGLITLRIWPSPSAFLISISFGFLANYLWAYRNPYRLAFHDLLSHSHVIKAPLDLAKKRSFWGWFSEK